MYQIVVGGKTFNAHQQLMDKLKKKVPLVEFDKTKQNHEVTILFCPISTRIGLDVKAAMDEIQGKANFKKSKTHTVFLGGGGCFVKLYY